ncbi:zonadhesin-like [Bicyclus anynana]|uniref:Zonadhesin-like n=1 Tax=Bicyclus anynana TaxID=110368 RepID=A0ABM3LHT6_BICAN|nr:zonadhesin-like [Bicyclus anynana]
MKDQFHVFRRDVNVENAVIFPNQWHVHEIMFDTEAQCGNNEVFDLCPPKCPGDECGVDPRLVLCPPNPQPGDPSCQPRCRCCDGYARNEEDQCIPRDECPSICGCNEVYDTCIAQCPPRTCDSIGKSIKCPPPLKPGDKRCEAGCRCADNYYRNDDNVCVPKCECQRCPKNETQVPCIEAKCERRECCDLLQPVTCVSINPKLCTEGCLCEDGYLRSKDGKCIPIGQCPEAQCGNNEVFDLCPPKCPGEECGVDPRLVLCPPNPQPGDPNCQPRCRCCDGYSKNEEGQCIPSDECPPTCGSNEVYDTCIAQCPPRTCDSIGTTVKCPPPLKPGDKRCEAGCRCADNYYRNDDNVCVPKSECQTCPQNERPVPCIQARCERRKCCDLLEPVVCVDVKPMICTKGCLCEDGYLRSEDGKCIPVDQCPEAQCENNEVFDLCPPTCPGEDCGVDPTLVLCPPNPQPGDPSCQPRCRCCGGYSRDEEGQCIPSDECPPVCEANEVYDTCIAQCPPRTCDSIGKSIKCPPPLKPGDKRCEAGCRCADNYYRNDDNVCVPKSECPPVCEANEVYDTCIAQCPPRTCDSIGKSIKCPPPMKPGDKRCEAGCRCADNYYRNDDNVCVPKSECPPVCEANEVYDTCIAQCPPRTCDSIGKSIKCPPPMKPGDKRCEAGCRCADNYYRNDDNECVPKSECPPVCEANEVYDTCIAQCPPRTCDSIGKSIKCPPPMKPGDKRCEAGCRCADNYYRNDDNECVPESECPPVCEANEVYDTCIAQCPPRTCDSIGKSIKCPPPLKPGDKRCEAGCRCDDNYYRNSDNVCVSKSECREEAPAPAPPGKRPKVY